MRGEEKAIRGMELSLSRHLNHQVMLKPPSFPHSPRFFSLFLLKWLRAKFVSLSTSFSHTQSLFLIRYSSQVLPTSSEFTSPSTPLSKEFLFCACLCLHISLFRYGKGKFLFFCWEGAYISRLRLI